MLVTFIGATVFLPNDIVETSATIEDGKIVAIGQTPQGEIIDASGLILAPAMIDVHGDAFERQVMPRPNVFFPMDTAVIDTDRQLAANGIATAYHAVTLGWEPGLRDLGQGRKFMETVNSISHRLTIEHRIQLRWETFAFEAFDIIKWAMAFPNKPSIAFNDHTSMALRGFDIAIQDRAFEHSPEFEIANLYDDRMLSRLTAKAQRSGLSVADYRTLLAKIWERRSDVPQMIAKLAHQAHAANIPMLSHDDTRAETRQFYRNHGVDVCEFPMVYEAAQSASKGGDTIIFGAPNAARGGSHIGSLAAGDMVEAGLCDGLASDYFYPAMLAAIARLDRERRADRRTLWALVSSGPAKAMKLYDRGTIAVGNRADLVLVHWPDNAVPAILGTWVQGRCAFRATPFSHC